jgi:pilus assembly protein Flp/PilA
MSDTAGATAIEYGLIAGLISLAILAGVGSTGDSIGSLWSGNADKLANAIGN